MEAGTGSGNYNAVKMKTQLDEILAQFESTASDNAHVLEGFFGLDIYPLRKSRFLIKQLRLATDAEKARWGCCCGDYSS